jgi:mannose-6-phosphate isomerase-like protein (cupin superfamily)
MRVVTAAFLLTLGIVSSAQEARQGYVLKVGEGEIAAGAIIKASPKNGTQGGVMLIEPFPDDFSTGLHYHVKADEFFYVISGRGVARFGGKDHPIEAGDVVFIPAGEDHALLTNGSTMELLAFLDKPGLDDEFRAWHRAYGDAQPVSLEQINAIAKKFGTVYKTLK